MVSHPAQSTPLSVLLSKEKLPRARASNPRTVNRHVARSMRVCRQTRDFTARRGLHTVVSTDPYLCRENFCSPISFSLSFLASPRKIASRDSRTSLMKGTSLRVSVLEKTTGIVREMECEIDIFSPLEEASVIANIKGS